jgi:arylsulfatase A-like enzyme
MASDPNVVVVHTDDTGRYVGPYGYDVDTPALQTLADEGLLFRNMHCAGPTCSPSRAAFTTGRSPHEAGMLGLAHRGFSLDDPDRHLANLLSTHGYETVLAGQQHEASGSDAAAVLGYDRVLEAATDAVGDLPIDHEHTRRDLANTASAADFVREREDARPFFLSLGLFNTHQPMPLEQDLVDPDGITPPAPLPDHPAVRREIAAYHVLAGYVDECVGTVYEALAEAGQLSNTLFVFTTDHGVPFPRMKCNLFDGGTGIAFVARFPEGYRAGEATDALCSNVDFVPTLCEYLDVPTHDAVSGESFVPVVRGEAAAAPPGGDDPVFTDATPAHREAVFGEVTYHAAYEPKRSVRTRRYRYVRRFDDEYTTWVRPNTDAGPSKSLLLEADFFDRERPREALYDTYCDPNERENLIDDAAYADVRDTLAGRLEDWMAGTDDPLLSGPVSKPPGAKADRRDAVDPGDSYEPADAR